MYSIDDMKTLAKSKIYMLTISDKELHTLNKKLSKHPKEITQTERERYADYLTSLKNAGLITFTNH